MNEVDKAIKCAGSVSELASAIGVSVQLVYMWRIGKRKIPAEKCTEIEALTHGTVRCESLRPDLQSHWTYMRTSQRIAA